MKKLTRDLVVPMISASVSWLILGITALRLSGFPEIREKQQHASQTFLAGVEEVIHQIGLEANIARQEVHQEHLGKIRFVT